MGELKLLGATTEPLVVEKAISVPPGGGPSMVAPLSFVKTPAISAQTCPGCTVVVKVIWILSLARNSLPVRVISSSEVVHSTPLVSVHAVPLYMPFAGSY